MHDTKLDIIGDVHGQRTALLNLLRELGWVAEDGNWRHPEGRKLVFVGDLVDKGPDSLGVARLVERLVASGRGLCLLGNHEYNLVEWRHRRTGPKSTNLDTIAQIERQPAQWSPILDFFESLPVALELPTLRVVHAAWHPACVDLVGDCLEVPSPRTPVHPDWTSSIRLHSPFHDGRLHPRLPGECYEDPQYGLQDETPLGVLIKGYEDMSAPFLDVRGKQRFLRVRWWSEGGDEVPRDRRIVFGHHWNLPPIPGLHDALAPPHPSGTALSAAWLSDLSPRIRGPGRRPAPAGAPVCVDYSGAQMAGGPQCVGAFRHPEGEVVWAVAPPAR